MNKMTTLKLIGSLSLALSLAACGDTGTPNTDLTAAQQSSEVAASVSNDVEQTLASLTDAGALSGLSAQGLPCRTADPATSTLNSNGKPVDSDQDGVPDNVTWVLNNCVIGGASVSGKRHISDPSSNADLAGSYLDEPQGLTYVYVRADGHARTVVSNGSSVVTVSNRTHMNIVRSLSERSTDSSTPAREATWINQVTVEFTAAPGQTIDRRKPLPAGTVSVNGPREWHVINGTQTLDRYLTIQTTSPLSIDPTCNSTPRGIFASSHAVSGAFNVLVYQDSARTQLEKTVTVTYQNCTMTITTN